MAWMCALKRNFLLQASCKFYPHTAFQYHHIYFFARTKTILQWMMNLFKHRIWAIKDNRLIKWLKLPFVEKYIWNTNDWKYVKGNFEWFPKHPKKSDNELQCFRREEKIWFGKGCKKQRREVRNTHRLLASKKVKLQKRNTKGRFLNSYGVGTHTS